MSKFTQHLQDIRYGSVARRKKWFVFSVAAAIILILILWLFVFGVETAVSNKTATSTGESFADIWKGIRESAQEAKGAFTASMSAIQNAQKQEDTAAATTTASSSPAAFVAPSPSAQPSGVTELH